MVYSGSTRETRVGGRVRRSRVETKAGSELGDKKDVIVRGLPRPGLSSDLPQRDSTCHAITETLPSDVTPLRVTRNGPRASRAAGKQSCSLLLPWSTSHPGRNTKRRQRLFMRSLPTQYALSPPLPADARLMPRISDIRRDIA